MRIQGLRSLLAAIVLASAPAFGAEEDSASLAALRAAAEQGRVDAQYELGILYEFGYNFPDHNAAAYAWYSRAADQGSAAAAKRRDLLRNQLSAAELERAQAMGSAAAGSQAH